MSADDDFTRQLRERIDVVGPAITVDTTHVIGRAHRRRSLTRGVAVTAAVTALALVGWGAAAQPWTQASAFAPAQPAPQVSATPAPTTADPADAGWPDAAYWHTLIEVRQDGAVRHTEIWSGHTEPGLIVNDGDLAGADGMGPASWTSLPIDGVDTSVSWDVLYSLPTDPVALEALLRSAVEPDRRAGTDDEKVYEMIWDLLNSSPASPDLRRALWSVASGLPGAVVTPGVADADGRPASMLENPGAEHWPTRLYFDPADGQLLEVDSDGAVAIVLEQGPATAPPVEPNLATSGCTNWATC